MSAFPPPPSSSSPPSSAAGSPAGSPAAGSPPQEQTAPAGGVAAAPVFDGSARPLHPRVWLVWAVARGGVVFVAMLVAAVVAAAGGVAPLAGVAILTGLVLMAVTTAWARMAWRRWSWSVHDDALELRHGVISRSASLVPFHRIQQIDISRDPVERALGLSSLVLRTAAATSDARVPGIASSQADELRFALINRAGLDDAV